MVFFQFVHFILHSTRAFKIFFHTSNTFCVLHWSPLRLYCPVLGLSSQLKPLWYLGPCLSVFPKLKKWRRGFWSNPLQVRGVSKRVSRKASSTIRRETYIRYCTSLIDRISRQKTNTESIVALVIGKCISWCR